MFFSSNNTNTLFLDIIFILISIKYKENTFKKIISKTNLNKSNINKTNKKCWVHKEQ